MALFQENTVFIDRGRHSVRGLLVRRGMGAFDILRKETLPTVQPESEGESETEQYDLLRFVHTLFPDEESFGLVLHPDELFTRSLDVPATDPALAQEILPGDLEALLPVPLEEVEIVASPWQVGAESTRMMAFAVEGRHLTSVAEPFVRTGKTLSLITPAAHALARALHFLPVQEITGKVIGQLHVGYESSIFNLLLDGKLAFSRSVPVGGRHFTLALAETPGLDEAKAEEFKLRSNLDLSRKDADEIAASEFSRTGMNASRLKRAKEAVREVAEELAGEIERSILASAVREPVHVYVSGGGSLLRGFTEFLEDRLNLHFRRYPLQLGEEPADQWILCLGAVQAASATKKERLDFLQTPAGAAMHSGQLRLKRFAVPAGLSAAALLIFLTGFTLSAVAEQQRLNSYREQMQSIAKGIAGINPAKDPVGEARNLCMARLRIMRSLLGGYKSLDVLKDITDHMVDPQAASVQFRGLRYNETDVELDLQVDNIQQTQIVQEKLQSSPLIASVEVVRRDLMAGQKVRLTLKLLLKPPQTGMEVDCK